MEERDFAMCWIDEPRAERWAWNRMASAEFLHEFNN